MIKGVALGVVLKNTHRQVLIDQQAIMGRRSDGSDVYELSDCDNNQHLGTIIFNKKKDNWDYKGPLPHEDLYQIARFIQNYSEDDWNF